MSCTLLSQSCRLPAARCDGVAISHGCTDTRVTSTPCIKPTWLGYKSLLHQLRHNGPTEHHHRGSRHRGPDLWHFSGQVYWCTRYSPRAVPCARICKYLSHHPLSWHDADPAQVGNGIQVPCNAGHVLRHLGLLQKLLDKAGGPALGSLSLNYSDGRELLKRDFTRCQELYGAPWMYVHSLWPVYHSEALDTPVVGADLS